MALSASQKLTILRHLCYPASTLTPNSLDYSKIVSDKLDAITGDVQAEVEKLLEWIDQTEDEIDKALSTAGLKRIDEIEFFGGNGEASKADLLRLEKSRYLKDLSSFISIPSRCRGGGMGCVTV